MANFLKLSFNKLPQKVYSFTNLISPSLVRPVLSNLFSDFYFIVDSSLSQATDIPNAQAFVTKFYQQLTVSPHRSRVSIVPFSDTVMNSLSLTDNFTVSFKLNQVIFLSDRWCLPENMVKICRRIIHVQYWIVSVFLTSPKSKSSEPSPTCRIRLKIIPSEHPMLFILWEPLQQMDRRQLQHSKNSPVLIRMSSTITPSTILECWPVIWLNPSRKYNYEKEITSY